MLTRSKPKTSALRYLLRGSISLVEHDVLAAGSNLLGHVNCPNSGSTADIEDTGLPVLGHRSLMQVVAACYGKQFVVDVHAIFFVLGRVSFRVGLGEGECGVRVADCRLWVRVAYLIARVHVDASSIAMIQPAIFQVIAVVSGHGQSGGR